MPKRPPKTKREDFNEAAFRVVREATERESEPTVDKKTASTESKDKPLRALPPPGDLFDRKAKGEGKA